MTSTYYPDGPRPHKSRDARDARTPVTERLARYIDKAMSGALALAACTVPRGPALFRAAARLGAFVGLHVLRREGVRAALLDVARANGKVRDDGEGEALRHIDRGLAYGAASAGDLRVELEKLGLWDDTAQPVRVSTVSLPESAPTPEQDGRAVRKAALETECIGETLASIRPARGSLVERYLCGVRGVGLPDRETSIGFHLSTPMPRKDGTVWRAPAMVAIVEREGEVVALQATPLRPDGRKLLKGSGRLNIGPIKGAAVRLAEMQADEWSEALGIAEGVETALAFSRITGAPCWAALGSDNFANFAPPSLATHVLAVVDHDPAGVEAATKLAMRLSGEHDVEAIRPPTEGEDWCDVARRLYEEARHAAA